MEKQKRNLNINGAGCYPGGEFDSVSIAGAGKIDGDIQCESFSGAGSTKVVGNISCKELSISGSGNVQGDIIGGNMGISGSCRVHGNLVGDNVTISGSGEVGGSAKVTKLKAYGSTKVGGDIEAEELIIKGGFKHTKLINAERVSIEAGEGGGSVSFNEMGATSVTINQRYEMNILNRLFSMFSSNNGKVIGKSIEADTIKIDHTYIDILRGDIIEIGPECEVGMVEYTGTLTVHDTSKVAEMKKIDK